MSCRYVFRLTVDPETPDAEVQQFSIPAHTELDDDITATAPKMGKFLKGKLVNAMIRCEFVCLEHGVKGLAELTIPEDELEIVQGYAASNALTLEIYVAENLMAAAILSAQSSDTIVYIPGTSHKFSDN